MSEYGSEIVAVATKEIGAGDGMSGYPAPVVEIADQTDRNIRKLNLAHAVNGILNIHFGILGLQVVLPPASDLLEILSKEINEEFDPDREIPDTKNLVLSENTATRIILIRLITFYSSHIGFGLAEGNYMTALSCILFVIELSRLAKLQIPQKCVSWFADIKRTPVREGPFADLIKRAEQLIPNGHSVVPVVERVPELPSARDYKDVTDEMIGRADVPYLIACGREARRAGDLEGIIRFDREIVRREPKNSGTHHFLALVFSDLGRYQEELDERRIIAELEPDDLENKRLLRKLEIRLDQKNLTVKRYEDLTEGSLEKINDADLPFYIKQAFEKRDWGNLLRFAEELKKRHPNRFDGYLYSAIALEKLGRVKESLETREALQQLILEGTITERNPGENAMHIKRLRRILKIKTLNEAQEAEDARDWEKSVELRRQLIKLNSSKPENFYIISFSLEYLGRVQEALEAWENFLALPDAIVKPEHSCRLEKLERKARGNRLADTVARAVGAEVAEVLGEPEAVEQETPEALPVEPEAVASAPVQPENPVQPSNINTSSFGAFLTSLKTAAEIWSVNGKGDVWRTIPEIDRENLREIMERLETEIEQKFSRLESPAFWKSFDRIYAQICGKESMAINIRALETLIERFNPINA